MKPPTKTPDSAARPWHGDRGELLVVLQFVILAAFIFTPNWNAGLRPDLLATTAPARTAALWLAGLGASAMAVAGFFKIRPYLTPLPYPVAHSELVTTGVYGIVRHPLYGCQLIAGLGWTVYTLSAIHLALLAIGFVFFDYKASTEEQWLTERHPGYPDYARRVCKLLPWIY